MGIFLKDPGATLDYAVDWGAAYLGGAAIGASAWSVAPDEPGGMVLVAEVASAGRTAATLGGGVMGHIYRVTNRINLADGRSDERTLTVRVEQR